MVRGNFLFIVAGLALLLGCGEADPDAFRFGLKSTPITLDPRFATDAASTRINRLLYRQLVDFDERFKPLPSLADWNQMSSKHYRFVLRDAGRVFSDGSRLSAADVAATYEFILDESNGSPHRGTIKHIERIEVVDNNTIDFFLAKPDALFPGLLVVGIVPKSKMLEGHGFNREPVGSGDFSMVEWPEDGRLVLERLRDKQRFEFIHVPKPTVRVLKLLRGEIDLMQNDLLPELVVWLEDKDEVVIKKVRGTNFAYLGFNMGDPIVGNPLVRRAIAHAVDRDAIIEFLMGGSARTANAILPPEHWAGSRDLAGIDHDPGLARSLLEQAGYGADNPIKLVYKTSTDPLRVRIATIIQHQLKDVGIDVELSTYDWGTFYGDIKAGRFQMYSLAWVGIKMPDIFRYTMHSDSLPPAGANRGRLIDPKVDELIETAEAAPRLSEQASLYRELQALLLDELPYVPLWYEDHYLVMRAGFEGYVMANDGNYDGLKTLRRTR